MTCRSKQFSPELFCSPHTNGGYPLSRLKQPHKNTTRPVSVFYCQRSRAVGSRQRRRLTGAETLAAQSSARALKVSALAHLQRIPLVNSCDGSRAFDVWFGIAH